MEKAEHLVIKMLSIMPYTLNAGVVPYLFELVELAQTEAWNEAITEANRHAKAKIVSVKSSFDESKYEKRCVVIESSILNLKK